MRWVNSLGPAAAALALAACGNYSTEDVRFLAALPTRGDLHVRVPASGASGALAACTSGEATVWIGAKPVSDGLNGGVDLIVGLVDAVRRVEPSQRADDLRVWGPFDDDRHPGREIRVVITRETGPDEAVAHRFAFEARVKGQADFTKVLTGEFEGPSASVGKGSLELNFEALWSLGMNDAGTPHGALLATYDRTGEPRRVGIAIVGGALGLGSFGYDFEGWADGSGSFSYRIPRGLDRLYISSSFDATGAGRAAVSYVTWLGLGGSFEQCWDASACLVYVNDPQDYSCSTPPCSLGEVGSCPAVPSPPF